MSEKQLFEVLQPQLPKKQWNDGCANNFENSNKITTGHSGYHQLFYIFFLYLFQREEARNVRTSVRLARASLGADGRQIYALLLLRQNIYYIYYLVFATFTTQYFHGVLILFQKFPLAMPPFRSSIYLFLWYFLKEPNQLRAEHILHYRKFCTFTTSGYSCHRATRRITTFRNYPIIP